MSLDYFDDGHAMVLCCDFCQEESEFYGSWNECIREAKEEGWKIFKQEDSWMHKCSLCVNKESNPRRIFQ